MNSNFSFSRFRLLVKKLFFENWLTLLGLLLLVFAILLVFQSTMLENDENKKRYIPFDLFNTYQILYFGFLLIIGGAIFTIFSTLIFSDKKRSSAFLQMPASHLEKHLALVFIGFFMFLIPFCLIHLSLDLVFMNLAHKHWEKAFVNIDKVENSAKYLAFLKTQEPKLALLYFNKTSPLILILACIHAIFMLGALYFQRVSYVKTIIFLFVLGLFLFVFNFSIDKLLYSNEVEYTNTTSTTEMGTLRNNIRNIWLYFAYFIPLILWGIAYIRLKEKEE